jgi:hypothetical protein
MQIEYFKDRWYKATWKKARRIFIGYGTTHARALEDCFREYKLIPVLMQNEIADWAKEQLARSKENPRQDAPLPEVKK